jgi:hypothetical protein
MAAAIVSDPGTVLTRCRPDPAAARVESTGKSGQDGEPVTIDEIS